MSRLEPIPYAVLKDFPPRGGLVSPVSMLSLAARFEEPDLAVAGAGPSFQDLLTNDEAALGIDELGAEGSVIRGEEPALLLLTFSDGQRDGLAVLGKLPLKLLRDFDEEWAADVSAQPPPEYLALLRTNRAHLDPLVVGWPGLKSDQIEPFVREAEVVHHGTWWGGSFTLRALSDAKRVKMLQKLFEPSFFGPKPNPFVLDGAFSLVKWQLQAGHEHTFAAVCPLGAGMADLRVGELLVELDLAASSQVSANDPTHPADGTRLATLPALVQLPERVRIQRYYYSGEGSRDYAMQDFQEDLHFESQVAHTSAILMRGRDEFALAIGDRSHHAYGLADTYGSGAVSGSRRLVVPNHQRAATLFAKGSGNGAIWSPLRQGVDYSARILAQRPPLHLRRAVTRLQPTFPFGLVIRQGL